MSFSLSLRASALPYIYKCNDLRTSVKLFDNFFENVFLLCHVLRIAGYSEGSNYKDETRRANSHTLKPGF